MTNRLIPAADLFDVLLGEALRILRKENSETFLHPGNVQMKRENLYKLREALDLLGVALAEHGHTWSPEERTAYDRAVRIINKADKS